MTAVTLRSHAPARRHTPLVDPAETPESMVEEISRIVLDRRAGVWWWSAMTIGLALSGLLVVALAVLFEEGVGVWGINIPVAWGFAIADYVWWIGLASGGTITSSLFFLLRAEWRSATNRIAESMTLFAAAAAGIMPIIHLGRFWYAYWLFPYANTMGTWPQFRSPLHWDFVALLTYVIGSVLFWYVGLLPDFATLRDRASRRGQQLFYGLLALGWQGSARQWGHFRVAYLVLAAIMAPLVCSVHSVVGLDFAGGLNAGWHETQFPPFFVFGAALSSFAFILVLLILLRQAYPIRGVVTRRHLDILARLFLTCSLLVGYSYTLEVVLPFYSDDKNEIALALDRLTGLYAPAFWSTVILNVALPQLLWFGAVRRSSPLLLLLGIGTVVGMWMERYLIVLSSLHETELPSKAGVFYATFWDWATLAGSCGLFLVGFLLCMRYVPMVSMYEMRELLNKPAEERS